MPGRVVEKKGVLTLTFPVTLQQIPKFEHRNNVRINVYGWDKKDKPYLLQKSKIHDTEQHVDLLLLEKGASSHYCWIKSFSRFARQPSDHKNYAKHYCHYCIQGFASKEKLQAHLTHGCQEITEARPVLPEPESDKAYVKFKNFDKQHKAPFVVYADFEALTRPVDKASKDPSKSYTDAYQTHEPCGFCIHIVSSDKHRDFNPIVYRGENTIQEFIFKMKEVEEMLMKEIKAVEPEVTGGA